jgi:hypothetical protein
LANESVGVTDGGPGAAGNLVGDDWIASSDMRRKRYEINVVVAVELVLEATNVPRSDYRTGILPVTSNGMAPPCRDVVRLKNVKIQRFDRCPAGAQITPQFGVRGSLGGVPRQSRAAPVGPVNARVRCVAGVCLELRRETAQHSQGSTPTSST